MKLNYGNVVELLFCFLLSLRRIHKIVIIGVANAIRMV
jgi:hypothetical protein